MRQIGPGSQKANFYCSQIKLIYSIFLRGCIMGMENLWATEVLRPKKAMHFWKEHYPSLITWGAVEDNLRTK